MKAAEIHYHRDTGIVTAVPFPDGEKFTVTEDCRNIELRAGDDVYAKIDAGFVHLESLTDEPLLIRQKEPFDGELKIETTRRPDQDVDAAEA